MNLSAHKESYLDRRDAAYRTVHLFVQCSSVLCLLTAASATEYCLTETFRAECRGPNDVILMERAMFGRMELGRCVTKNYGHVGCSVDVLRYLDRLCSGRRSCQLTVSDPSLVRTKPCPVDFSSYLEASFRCVKSKITSLQ
jgi:Galactose binding lectin domain